jgi:hypothetical protein
MYLDIEEYNLLFLFTLMEVVEVHLPLHCSTNDLFVCIEIALYLVCQIHPDHFLLFGLFVFVIPWIQLKM